MVTDLELIFCQLIAHDKMKLVWSLSPCWFCSHGNSREFVQLCYLTISHAQILSSGFLLTLRHILKIKIIRLTMAKLFALLSFYPTNLVFKQNLELGPLHCKDASDHLSSLTVFHQHWVCKLIFDRASSIFTWFDNFFPDSFLERLLAPLLLSTFPSIDGGSALNKSVVQ